MPQADKVELQLVSENGENDNQTVTLTISDNGKGFDPATVRKDHFGLGIIHERVALIGAHLTLETEKGYGTLIRVQWNGRSCEDG